MPEEKVESGYGFNGTEKVEELGAGHNITFYREQENLLGGAGAFVGLGFASCLC